MAANLLWRKYDVARWCGVKDSAQEKLYYLPWHEVSNVRGDGRVLGGRGGNGNGDGEKGKGEGMEEEGDECLGDLLKFLPCSAASPFTHAHTCTHTTHTTHTHILTQHTHIHTQHTHTYTHVHTHNTHTHTHTYTHNTHTHTHTLALTLTHYDIVIHSHTPAAPEDACEEYWCDSGQLILGSLPHK